MNYIAHGVLVLEAQHLLNDVEHHHKINVVAWQRLGASSSFDTSQLPYHHYHLVS